MPKSKMKEKDQEIRYRDRIITFLGLILIGLVIALIVAPSSIDIHRIPDPARLLTHKAGDIPKTHVHAFTRLALETIYSCGEDCSNDIPANVDALRAYVTDSCRNEIKTRVENNPNLYNGRTRQIKYVFDQRTQGATQFSGDSPLGKSDQTVKIIDDGTWHVFLKYHLLENVVGYETINAEIFYPVRIVRSSRPKNINEYQLAFDCFYRTVERKVRSQS